MLMVCGFLHGQLRGGPYAAAGAARCARTSRANTLAAVGVSTSSSSGTSSTVACSLVAVLSTSPDRTSCMAPPNSAVRGTHVRAKRVNVTFEDRETLTLQRQPCLPVTDGDFPKR